MHQRLRWLSALLLLVSACDSDQATKKQPVNSSAPAKTAGAASADPPKEANAAAATSVAKPNDGSLKRLKFHRDNIDEVLALAKQRKKLVFIDAWAEWCHTCLSMESYVLSSPSLATFSESFEFVALDTENVKNSPFLDRFKMTTWPTYFVVSPDDQRLVGLWPGSGSINEMRDFLQQSLDTADALSAGKTSHAPLSELVKARDAQSRGDFGAAATAYKQAYSQAPPNWPRLDELLLGYSRSLLKLKRYDECAQLAEKHLDDLEGAAVPIQFALHYFECSQKTSLPDRKRHLQRAIKKMETIAYGDNPHMSPDDRADALNILSESHTELRNRQEAARAQKEQLRVVEEAAAQATSPEQARTFDRARSLAYVALGRDQEAVDLLTAREKQFPDSYEPPWRLYQVYRKTGQPKEALAALTRAIERTEGPRLVKLLRSKSKLQYALKDFGGQLETLELEVAERRKLNRTPADARDLRAAERALAEVKFRQQSSNQTTP